MIRCIGTALGSSVVQFGVCWLVVMKCGEELFCIQSLYDDGDDDSMPCLIHTARVGSSSPIASHRRVQQLMPVTGRQRDLKKWHGILS